MKREDAGRLQLLYSPDQPQLILVGGPKLKQLIELNVLTCCDGATGLSWSDGCVLTKDGLETEMDHPPAISLPLLSPVIMRNAPPPPLLPPPQSNEEKISVSHTLLEHRHLEGDFSWKIR